MLATAVIEVGELCFTEDVCHLARTAVYNEPGSSSSSI